MLPPTPNAPPETGRPPALWDMLAIAAIAAGITLFGHLEHLLPLQYTAVLLGTGMFLLPRLGLLGPLLADYLLSPTIRWRLLFLLWGTLTLFWSARQETSVVRLVTLTTLFVIGFVIYTLAADERNYRRLLHAVVLANSAGVTLALLQLEPVIGSFRLEGWFGNPNVLAVSSVFAFWALGRLAMDARRRWLRFYLLFTGVLYFAGIVGSASRKGIVGIAALWLVALALRGTRRMVLQHVAVVGAVLAVVVARYPDLVSVALRRWDDLLYLVTTYGSPEANLDRSVTLRSSFYAIGQEIFERAPWRGSGMDTFSSLSNTNYYAHSNFIEISVSTGLVGLVLYYGLFARAGHQLLMALAGPRRREAIWLGALLLVLLFMDLAMVSYYEKLPFLMLTVLAARADLLFAELRREG